MQKLTIENIVSLRALGTDAGRVAGMLTDATLAIIAETLTLDDLGRMSQKGLMRCVEGANFIASGDVKRFDAATAGLIAVCYLMGEGESTTFENVRFALAGKGNEDSKLPKHVQGAKLRKVCGVVPRGTIESKASRTVGKGGLLQALAVTEKTDAKSFTVRNLSHPFVQRYASALQALTDGALSQISDKLNKTN